MAKWRGNLTDLLTEEQRKKIEEHLSATPPDLFIDRREAKLNRYPARLWDSEGERPARNLIASERPVYEVGTMLISNQPIPQVEHAILELRLDGDRKHSLHGHALPSRPGLRAGDQPLNLHFSVFQSHSDDGMTLTR
jgi:hypothetical protein